nr:ribonuclease H-like domain-containing protein [Tanacetum cinerariifolium]
MDEKVESDYVNVVFDFTPSNVNTVESKHESVDVKIKGVFNTVESKTIRKNSFRPPIIEDWNSDDESEVEFKPNKEVKTVGPSTKKIKFVKIARETVEKHLHYVCDQKVARPVWNNTSRVNHKNFTNKMTHPHPKRRFIPQAVVTRSGKFKTAGATINVVRLVNTADSKSNVNCPRLMTNALQRGYSQVTRPFNKYSENKNNIFNKKVNNVMVKDTTARKRAVKEYKEKRVIDSGCSKHMTGNKCYLTEYEDYDSGFVSFRDGKGRISGKVVTDDFSRFSWVFLLATKDETSGILKTFITRIENQLDYKVKVTRCDNGTEFKNSVMNQFCKIKGIKREFSVAMTPHQNGVVERKNRTLIEAVRAMLVDSKSPTTFWAEAINTACYVLNRALVIKPHNKTPYELIRRRPPDRLYKTFECPVTILNTKDHLGKFDGKADEGFFVGYSVVSKAMRVFNKRTRIVEETLHIRFLKNTPNVKGKGSDWLFDVDSLTISMNYMPVVTGNQTNGIVENKDNIVAGPKDSEVDAGKKDIEVDESGASDKGGKDDQATRSKFERLLHQQRQTEHIHITNSINTVFQNKKDERGIVVKNKARLVAQGHTQEEGIDYDEFFVPVPRIEAIRLFLAYASFKDFVVYQMDVKSAFLYEKIEEEVYVYIDDIIFGSTKRELSTEFEKLMQDKFQMSYMGELSFFLGLQVQQKSDGLFISQDKYVADILTKFNFSIVKIASTPMKPNKALIKDKEAEDVLTYTKDFTFHVVKRIFRYLKGQPKLGLWYLRDLPFDLEAFSDSDCAEASLDRKSKTGEYVAVANCCGQVL